MFDKKGHSKKFFKYLNTCHPNIKVIFEEVQDNKISFLDISITRHGNELQSSLFCKNTFTSVYLTLTAIYQICTKEV